MNPEPYLQRLTGRLVDGLDRLPEEFRQRHIDWLRSVQNPDGGFSGRAGGSDLYYTGFALRSLAVLQGLTPDLCDLVQFVRSRRRADGGYVEIAPMKRSGANPTAAAVGILQIAGALEDHARLAVVDFLAELPSSFEGGLRANDRIPAADLLS